MRLKPGDAVGIVSTARKISESDLSSAVKLLESWGYNPRFGNTIGLEDNQFAGSDEMRAMDLQAMWADPQIKAVFFARGGYGTIRILAKLNPRALRRDSKWMVGFSDLTALHAWISHYCGQPTLHGPMPFTFRSSSQSALSRLHNVLGGKIEPLTCPPHHLNRNGSVSGRLIGGNLSMLYSINGCAFDWNYDGAILFLEDLDEYLYHIDRMMMNMACCGKLNRLKGMIVGGLTDMHDNETPFGETAEQIIRRHAERYSFPICFGFPAGHIEDNQPLLFGMSARLEVGDNAVTLQY